MKRVPCIAVMTAVIAVMTLSAGHVFAHSQPIQYYGGGGYLYGQVLGFNYYYDLMPIAWAKVVASNGYYTNVASTGGDGGYGMFLPAGLYNVTAFEPGFLPRSMVVAVSDGSSSSINFYLEESRIPVPEFPTQALPVILLLALAATLLVKKRKVNQRN